MSSIENLLPHRSPFLFVDHIISASKEEIIAIQTFDDDDAWLTGSFKKSEFNFVPGMILIESMAQCGGAGIRSIGLTNGLFGLASIECAKFLKGVEFKKEVKYIIQNIRVNEKLVKQSGIGYVEGEPVVEASWLCVRLN